LRKTASFDVLSVKIGLTDSPVGEFKDQRNVVNFEHGGVYISPIWEAKTLRQIEPKLFLLVGVYDIITSIKFGDDRFRGFGLAEGQRLLFS